MLEGRERPWRVEEASSTQVMLWWAILLGWSEIMLDDAMISGDSCWYCPTPTRMQLAFGLALFWKDAAMFNWSGLGKVVNCVCVRCEAFVWGSEKLAKLGEPDRSAMKFASFHAAAKSKSCP